jgi:hypothetical protein
MKVKEGTKREEGDKEEYLEDFKLLPSALCLLPSALCLIYAGGLSGSCLGA